MRIIHLSDIHYKNDENSEKIIKKMIDDLDKKNKENEINLILITGDLIDKGGISFGSIESAFQSFEEDILSQIIKKLNMAEDRIIFCPGNHDIDRKKIDKYLEIGLKNDLDNEKKINDFIEERKTCGDNTISRIEQFKNFESKYSNSKFITNFESNYIVNIDNKKVGVTSFNTSWRCSGEDDEKLLFGKNQITNSINIINECDIKIAIMHHSFEYLQEFEKRSIKDEIINNYDYLFLGHVHNNDLYMNMGLLGNIFVSIAQSNSSENIKYHGAYAVGYSIIDINFDKQKIRVRGRKYSDIRDEYVDNVDVFGDDGYKDFPLLLDSDKQIILNKKNIVNKSKENHIDEFDEHLLSFKTDSIAPKTLDKLFILPRIIDEKKEDIKEKEKEYNLLDICSIDESVIVYGIKESGKTILIDKLYLEYANNFDKYNKVPVRIDFNDKINNINTEIKRFLSINKLELEEYIENNDIVLLIDNLDFNDRSMRKVKLLEDFIEKNPNIKIISTCQTIFEKEISMEVLKKEKFIKMKSLYITSWRSKEIDNMISVWYGNGETIESGKVHNDIIQMFKNTRMSVTPLNISMFLWITEHNTSSKLINKGKMIECFFEYLLEKLKYDDIYSDKFDYTNKMTLLSSIAYKIYKDNDYKIEYTKLLEYIKEYIVTRQFSIDYNEILDYFLNKGIFVFEYVDNEKYIRFRFECFYRFFITQYMLSNDDFKKYVLEEENYLLFQDEIEYYTGIRRNQVDILNTLTERMEKITNEYYYNEYELSDTIDKYFEVNKSMIDSIEGENIDNVKLLKESYNPKKSKEKNEDYILKEIQKESAIGQVVEKKYSSNFSKLLDIWSITAKVLKNTEEIDEKGLKNSIYRSIIKCSAKCFTIYKLIVDSELKELMKSKKEFDLEEVVNDISISSKVIPLIYSKVLNEILATKKLELTVKLDCNSNEYSELEKLISIMLYLDINSSEALKVLKNFLNKSKYKYIKDIALLQLIYKYINTQKKEFEEKYLEVIVKLSSKNQGKIINFAANSRIVMKSNQKESIKKYYEELKDSIVN